MHWNPKLAQIVVILWLGASGAGAQEHGRVAVDLGYPPAFAVLWRVSDRIALRPEFSFSYSAGGQNPKVWTVTPGASALLSIHSIEGTTPYVGARLAGFWIKDGPGPEQWLGAVLVGARHSIERHFGVSGETGVAYTRLRFRFGPAGTPVAADVWNVAPTGRVSALLYF